VISVSLPQTLCHDGFVIRLPEWGGLAAPESGLPRGYLLLRVEPSAEADASVSFAMRRPEIEAVRRALRDRAASPAFRKRVGLVAVVTSVLLLTIWLLFRK
jgi:hypothetical protein